MRINKKLLTLYVIGLHFIIAFLMLKTDFFEKVRLALGYPRPEIGEHYLEMIQYHSRIDKTLPKDSVLFIGDSHIQSLYCQLEGLATANFGIGSDTTVGVRQRLSGYSSLDSAKVVVLQIGINDLDYRSVQQTLQSYTLLLEQIPKTTSILLNAVFPVSGPDTDDAQQWNQKLKELNSGLEMLCNDRQGCRFLDLGSRFLDADGTLADKYHIGDGVHLSTEANKIWKSAITRELKEIE